MQTFCRTASLFSHGSGFVWKYGDGTILFRTKMVFGDFDKVVCPSDCLRFAAASVKLSSTSFCSVLFIYSVAPRRVLSCSVIQFRVHVAFQNKENWVKTNRKLYVRRISPKSILSFISELILLRNLEKNTTILISFSKLIICRWIRTLLGSKIGCHFPGSRRSRIARTAGLLRCNRKPALLLCKVQHPS